ncbi:MAG: peptide-methionine (S)-S-oxide reductase, partial [Candidatus Thermoplasmatota archaeon]|nr:peptide-methionine (S)-S-oxide reductase [Candidatus Thermoplasmatota archaeon]
MSVKEIVLGGGCFWCMEAVFQMINGVVSVEPGYSGGHFAYPKYEDVCSDKTGHAEVVRIRYDDSVLDLNGIL